MLTQGGGRPPALQNAHQRHPAPMNPLLWPARSVANGLGLAWWARVETRSPDAVYWFGPFVRRHTLDAALPAFLDDLRAEGPASLEVHSLQTRRGEPLTEAPDLGEAG
jgi:hypothetical protein